MSDEPKHTYSAREIVLEFFPATNEKLVPKKDAFKLLGGSNGELKLLSNEGNVLLVLQPVSLSGNAATQVCCDVCQLSAPRHYLQMYRFEVPGSQGRRFKYTSLCRNRNACDLRRLNDDPLKELVIRAFKS